VLEDVENEVHRNARLRRHYPWFDGDAALASERLARRLPLSREEKAELDAAAHFLHDWVLRDVSRFTTGGRSPPSLTDCRVLALGQLRPAIVATDDLVREIYDALEANGDLTATWREAKHTVLAKVFGRVPR
jgi:hypothetical protein